MKNNIPAGGLPSGASTSANQLKQIDSVGVTNNLLRNGISVTQSGSTKILNKNGHGITGQATTGVPIPFAATDTALIVRVYQPVQFLTTDSAIISRLNSLLTRITSDTFSLTPVSDTMTIYSTSTTVLSANTSRKSANIYNGSGSTIFIAEADTIIYNPFRKALVNGAFYTITEGYTGKVTAITSGGTAVINKEEHE